MNRRDFSTALLGAGFGSAALSFGSSALAQAGAPTEGKQYSKVEPPVPTISPPNKIEVLEFFSFECPFCRAFEPVVAEWSKKLRPDVAFQRVPVSFLANAENFMKIYYALDTLGQVSTMQSKVFSAYQDEKHYLDRPADISAVMAKNGMDGAKFIEIFNSFSVATKVARAKKLVAAYNLNSVPTLAVQGHYETSPALAGGLAQALTTVDFLVQTYRKA